MESALASLRASSWVDRIGLALVGIVVAWLAVNFFKDPIEFVNVGIIGLTNGAIYGAQAAQVLLDAIENSDGTRSDVIAKMFATEVTDGLLGSFKFNENGDPEDAEGAVVGFTVYVATDKLETAKAISPSPEVVAAAGA